MCVFIKKNGYIFGEKMDEKKRSLLSSFNIVYLFFKNKHTMFPMALGGMSTVASF